MDIKDYIVLIIVFAIAFIIGRFLPNNPLTQLSDYLKNFFRGRS